MVADLHAYRGEAWATQHNAEHLIALSTEYGFPQWLAVGTTLRGWAIAVQEQYEEGIALIYQGLAAARGTAAGMRRLPDLLLLARACIEAGRFDEAMKALTEARTVVIQPENHVSAAIDLHKGLLFSRWDAAKAREAETYFRSAIAAARKFRVKMRELQATVGLARVLAKRGRGEEARAMLAEIYKWFTEGFDTPDLKEAQALLNELGGPRR